MTAHGYQGPTASIPGTTTGNQTVQSTLIYTDTMQPPHPPICEYI